MVMKKIKLITLLLGTSALSIVPVFTSSCTSDDKGVDQIVILGEQSCHVAAEFTFTHQFTAYVLPTAVEQDVEWSLNIDNANNDIKPFVSINELGLLTISHPTKALANRKFTVNVVAKDKENKKVTDTLPFEINVDRKLQIYGSDRVIYRNYTDNVVGPWTVNAELEGEWSIENYDTAASNGYEFSSYFYGEPTLNTFSITPYYLTGWTDLSCLSFNLQLKFTPYDPKYKDAFETQNIMLDVFDSDSMTVTPTEEDNNYIIKNDGATDKIFTISNYGSMTYDGFVLEYAPTFYLYPVTEKGKGTDNHYYTIDETPIDEESGKFTVNSDDRESRADETPPFKIVIRANSTLPTGIYFLEMDYNGPEWYEKLYATDVYYYTNFIEVI